MRARLLFGLAAVLIAVLSLVPARAQDAPARVWQAFPAYNEVTAVATSGEDVWAATAGGVFRYSPASGEISRFTAADGLTGGDVGALYVDPAGVAWIGYRTGILDRLDGESGDIRSFYDLERAGQYASRGVRRIRAIADRLYLSTDFGVVVFDPARQEVRETYARFGTLSPATPVNDVIAAPLPDGQPGLWVATAEGVASAPAAEPNLQIPSAWTVETGFEGEALSLGALAGTVFAGGGPEGTQDLYERLTDTRWVRRFFIDNPITTLVPDGDRLVGVALPFVYLYTPGQPVVAMEGSTPLRSLRDVVLDASGQIWAGDAAAGLVPVPEPPAGATGVTPFDVAAVVPEGPYTNRVRDTDARGDVVWTATRSIVDVQIASLNRLDPETGTWSIYRTDGSAGDVGASEFLSVDIGPDGTVYGGSQGDGLVVISPDGAVTRYDETNSTLLNAGSQPDYVVTSGVAFEGDDRWVLNLGSLRPLQLLRADGSWAALPRPPGIGGGDEFQNLAIDTFGQKWFSMQSTGGLTVWDTGDDPASPADDRGRRFSSGGNGQGLPGSEVRDVAVDLQGRVWLGTERGIAYVFSPGSAFGADAALAVPQWPRINEELDTTEEGPDWLLRDVNVSDLEVDPAGQLWVATSSGLYLVNAAGDAVVATYTSRNSPLPSDDVFTVTVDPTDGTVYVTTGSGLYAFAGDATAPRVSSESLRVSPSPFRPDRGDRGLLISGLAAAQSEVRILTVSGEVVHATTAAGGSFRWDGVDDRTGRPVPSGVYLVAAAASGADTLYGKIAVVR